MKIRTTLCAGAALLAAMTDGTLSFAQSTPTGGYLLGGAGQSRLSINQGELDAAAAAAGAAVPSSVGNTDTAWKLGGGYRLGENFAVEGGYYSFGKPSYSNPGAPGPNSGVTARPSAWAAFGVGMLPVAEGVSLVGKVGVAYTRMQADTIEAQTYSNTSNKTNFAWGLGVQYDFTHNWAVRGEYENFGRVGETPNFVANTGTIGGTLSALSVSAVYTF